MANIIRYEIRLAKRQANLREPMAHWENLYSEKAAFDRAYGLSEGNPDSYVAVWAHRDDGQFTTRLMYYPQSLAA